MTRWAALLRGVNVGGHRRVPMADLRAGLIAAGLQDVSTYLQSGNAVFESDLTGPGEVAALVRTVVAQCSGVDCDVVVRTAAELAAIIGRNPWPDRTASPSLLHVLLLSAPGEVGVRRVGEREQVHLADREVWVFYGDGAGRTRLQVEVPGVVVTARNWSTVTALASLTGAG